MKTKKAYVAFSPFVNVKSLEMHTCLEFKWNLTRTCLEKVNLLSDC